MFQKVKMLVLTLLGLAALPVAENKISLSDDQKQLLKEAGGDDFLEKFIEAANRDLADAKALEGAQSELSEAKKQLKALLDSNGIDLLNDAGAAEDAQEEGASPELQALITRLESKITHLEGAVRTLASESEADVPLIPNNSANMKIVHSRTHLFASDKSFDAFEGRNWNKRAAGLNVGATEWTGVNIERINEDFGAYWREERDEVLNILRDYRGLPAHWGVISNVGDQITYAAMLTGEVTQARKKAWLPKNQHKFIPMKGQVYPVQIDLEWEGFELQKMETSWMNRWNKEGSQPYKMSFVRFLLVSILEKAREEDKIVLVNGVHVPTADDETVAQSFMYRGKGLLKLMEENINKTYKAFNMGVPTSTNIVDYVKEFGERLPAEIKNAPGLHLYMSPSWIRKYYERRKVEDGLMPTYQPGVSTVEGYPNIMLTQLDYMEGTDFMFLTTRDNISILQNIKAEESLLKVDMLKRNIYIYGDYKTGILVHAFGIQWEEGTPQDFRNQLVWSNDVAILKNVYAPIPANDATPSALYHNTLQTGVNTGATAITTIDDLAVGQYVTIRGNSGANPSTIADSGNFDLDSAITLSENVEITLYKKAASGANHLVEISRKTLNVANEEFVVLAPGATTADAALGHLFLTSANAGATAITNITNAVVGEVYTIRGGSSTNATTIAASGNFSRISAGITLSLGNEIVVQFNGSKFVELSRVSI
jgi:hypothetical protein